MRRVRGLLSWLLWLGVPLALVAGVHLTGTTVAMVRTDSMLPSIAPADLVIATRTPPSEVTVGDVVVFTPQVAGTTLPPFVHRITAHNTDGTWVTQGDANEFADAARVTDADLHGVVRVVLPTRFLKWSAVPIIGGMLLGLLAGWTLWRRLFRTTPTPPDA